MRYASVMMLWLVNLTRIGTQRNRLETFAISAAACPLYGERASRRPWQFSVLAVLLALCAAGRAEAEIVYYMYGTGVGADLTTTSGTDQYWNIVALPGSATGYPSTPYDALVPRSTNVNWIGGGTPQTGTVVSGSTYYWISANTSATPVTTGTYNWIVAQDFTVSTPGSYEFNFNATVDNELQFFVGGTPSFADPQLPTIVGGTQIGPTLSGTGIFRNIYTFTGTASLPAGTNTAYAVVKDWGAVTGVIVTESSYVMVVPEPSTCAMALAAFAWGGWRLRRRRNRDSGLQ